jgi:hypothetical protein
MKKLTRRAFTAAGILAAIGAGSAAIKGCDPFEPFDNEIEGVYGPPPEYNPDNNGLVDVYGPPEDFGYEEEGDDGQVEGDDGQVEGEDDFDPTANELMDVYGPPAG